MSLLGRPARSRLLATAVTGALLVGGLVVVAGVSGASLSPRTSLVFRQGEPPGVPITNIFPINTCPQYATTNTQYFQPLLFRPLYWYGKGASLAVQPTLSIGQPPLYSAPSAGGFLRVAIVLKHWRFANGEHVTAQSVRLFLNLWHAEAALNRVCGPVPGDGIPTDVVSVSAPHGSSGNEIVLDFASPVNARWMTADFLSFIVPMPRAWDRVSLGKAAGSGGCGTGAWGAPATDADCNAVYTFLENAASTTSSYATSPLWKAVDGPYRVQSFSASGHAVLVPNPSYSGPQHSHLKVVDLLPFATPAAAEAALASHKVQAAEVPTTALGPSPAPGVPGPNLVPGIASAYEARWEPAWQFDDAQYNYTASDPKLAAVDQPFIRQALQGAIDQDAIIANDYDGYATRTCSPIPFNGGPPNPCANPYDPSGVLTLLSQHGFQYNSDLKVQECLLDAGCGTGLPFGYRLSFSLVYLAGLPQLAADVAREVTDWAAVGLAVTATAGSLPSVIAGCSGAVYAICDSVGWAYQPAYDPSGEGILATGSAGNFGGYSDATMDALIAQTTAGAATSLTLYATFAAGQDPVLWQPTAVTASELEKTCAGALAPNAFGDFMPEYVTHC